MMKRIWCLGDAVVDLLPDDAGRLLQCPGGAPANVAVGIARLAGSSGFIGRVGDDPFGQFLCRTLAQEKVDVSHMRKDAQQRTSTVVVALDEYGERTFTFMVRPSADLFLTPDDLPRFQCGEWLHCCSIALLTEPSRTAALTAMQRVREAGGFVSFDPNIRLDLWSDAAELLQCLSAALQRADVVKLSVEELAFMTDTADIDSGIAQLAQRFSLKLLLVTQGSAGVRAYFDGRQTHYPARAVISVDTTGAGDAFVAGLLWELAQRGLPADEAQLAACLRTAQACGALATTAKGAMTALPNYQQLQQHGI
ncbi:aminoimidazole riboside kinase (plasmid) [Pantoea dispersa]|uniref:aminoimidazole riboside kinase n=1 Tax=Pantoea TaxID=53335 RepID=UPI00141A2F93|nr:aminoimidazole riboside kinase [Pantoea sp. Ap-870]NIE51673.1 aminoimidazole riboside kinase [Pantoea sp. Ap-870]